MNTPTLTQDDVSRIEAEYHANLWRIAQAVGVGPNEAYNTDTICDRIIALARRALAAPVQAVADADIEPMARFMADNLGHGMTEKTIGFAKLAVEYLRYYRSALASPPAASGTEALPTYGSLPWNQLGRDVREAQTDSRDAFDFGETYPGHAMCGINFNSLARIIDKYRPRAALPDGGERWRDIASAPKTRGAYLVWCPERMNTYVVTWQDSHDEPGWFHFGGGSFNRLLEKPTHWQPLPAAPVKPAKKREAGFKDLIGGIDALGTPAEPKPGGAGK